MRDLFDLADVAGREVYSVSRLNRETRFILNDTFGSLWVEGEISNLSAPASGHLYFTLKDAEAQVRCAMFRPQVRASAFRPANGDQVLLKAQVSLYEPRGDFQLVVDSLEAAGIGALLQAFENLKRRLAAEGLFAAEHKQSLPSLPRSVGVITSPSGAAVRDILTVLKRRFPAIPVIVYPTKVQGADAPAEIVRALERAGRFKHCDVLILARGGGSLEDLWAFNDERVARAIYACELPVITGIGHEIDTTIADFVADVRAPTPSAAAEAVSPDRADWLERLRSVESRLWRAWARQLAARHTALAVLARRLGQVHPEQRLRTQSQRLDDLEARLRRALEHRLLAAWGRWRAQTARLWHQHPAPRVALLQATGHQLHQRLLKAATRILEQPRQQVAQLAQRLQALSPLATLARGYAIARHADSGRIIHSHRDIQPGDIMETRLAEGCLVSRVESTQAE